MLENDLQAQLALAADIGPDPQPLSSEKRVVLLEDVALRFPDRPEPYVYAMRTALAGSVLLNRSDECRLFSFPCSPLPPTKPAPLSAYLRNAEMAERVDPDNGFIHTLAALGQFAAQRDEAAYAELKRAADSKEWREYSSDIVYGAWKLRREQLGGEDGLAYLNTQACASYPDFAQLRSMARLVVAQAVADELVGRIASAVEKRRAIRRVGSLMRSSSHTSTGCLVGGAIENIAFSNVDGDRVKTPKTVEDKTAYRVAATAAYLRAHGYAADALEVEQGYRHASDAKSMIRTALGQWPSPALQVYARRYWAQGVLLCALWTAVVFCLAAFARLSPLVRRPVQWSLPVRWACTVALILAAVCAVKLGSDAFRNELTATWFFESLRGVRYLVPMLGVVGLATVLITRLQGRFGAVLQWFLAIALSLSAVGLAVFVGQHDATSVWCIAILGLAPGFALVRRHGLSGYLTYAGAYLLATAVLLAFGYLVLTQAAHVTLFKAQFDDQANLFGSIDLLQPAIWLALAALCIPTLIAAGAAVFARLREMPPGYTVLHWFAKGLMPVVCLLTIAYAVLLHGAMGANARLVAQCRQIAADERQFIVAATGKPWPPR
jgi:hypothetical protein